MIHGIWGSPFVSLEEHLDLTGLDDVHEEVCLGLAEVAVDYTGGSHRSMGIVPPSLVSEPWVDYGEVLRSLDARETARFLALGDDREVDSIPVPPDGHRKLAEHHPERPHRDEQI